MSDLNPKAEPYAGKLRTRVCGICIKDDRLLLVKHGATVGNNAFWAPPGGGLAYGETMHNCLAREVREETGLQVHANRFLFVNEFMQAPLHAVEFFFEASMVGGQLKAGSDPEATADNQLIEAVEWLSIKEIQKLPMQDKHRVLQHLLSLDDLLGLGHNFIL